MKKLTIALFSALIGTAALAQATDHSKMDHSTMDHSAMGHSMPSSDESPATKAYRAANDAMHTGMAVPFTGDADVDFIQGMIPHHQGAVDMARIVLEHGSDPQVRELAEAVIAAQQEEIDWMRAWLAERGIE